MKILITLMVLCLSFNQPVADTYVGFGDSILAGNELNHSGQGGTNNQFGRWFRKYAIEIKGGVEENYGVSGSCMVNNWGSNGTAFEDRLSDVPSYSSATHASLTLAYGFNEYYRSQSPPHNLTTNDFLAIWLPKLNTILEYCHNTKGWPYNKINIVWNYIVDNPPYYVTEEGWNTAGDAIKEVTIDKGCNFIDFRKYSLRGDAADFTLNTFTSERDYIHPMDAANLVMADSVDAWTFSPVPPTPPITIRGRRAGLQ